MTVPAPDWPAVTAFRRAERERCRALRAAVGPAVRRQVQANIDRVVDELLAAQPAACLGFYWPIRGEIPLFGAMRRAVGRGATVALPVVVAKDQPLVFRAWLPDTHMTPGFWSIPVPEGTEEVDPQVLFVPLVGFDAGRYRLGNGGGYYDRTLAARSPRPATIGVGCECLRLPTIHPQPHDLPMDRIVTESA